MDVVQSGMSDGVKQGEGAMNNINASISNVTDAVEGIGGDVMAQGEKAKARWGAIQGNLAGTMALARGKIGNMRTAAQATMAQNAAAKAGKSAEELLKESVVANLGQKMLDNPIATIVNKTAEIPGAIGEKLDEAGKHVEEATQAKNASFAEETARLRAAAETEAAAAEPPTAAGGRRRRRSRRKSRKKKRRKSRKKRRKSRRKRRSRRRRGGDTTRCECKFIGDNVKVTKHTDIEPGGIYQSTNKEVLGKFIPASKGGRKSRRKKRKSRKSRRRRKRSSKKSRRRRRR